MDSSISHPLLLPTLAGLVTWGCLNRHTVRGDYALLALCLAFPTLYLFIRTLDAHHTLARSFRIYAVYLLSLVTSTVAYRLSPFHPLAAYPGPITWRLSSFVLAMVSLRGRRHLYIHDFHRKYGKFVRIGPNSLSINSSKAGPTIYGAAHHMLKDESYAKPGHVPGIALFFKQDKEDHAKRKRIWANAFTVSAVEDFFPPMERRTWQLTQCIQERTDDAGVCNLGLCLAHWSYDFMGEMVFGGSNSMELMKNGDPQNLVIGGKMATVVHDSIGQAPWLLDILWHLPGSEAMHRARHRSATMMRNRVKAGDVNIRDLSTYLLEGDRRTGEKISMSDLEIEAVIAMAAGSDNTSSLLVLSMFFLLSHPPAYKNLQAELDKVFPDGSVPLDADRLAKIPLLEGVINEALRLGTPFFNPRIVPDGGVLIDGESIPGGTIVALSAYSQQISEENFCPDPLVFRPERWLPGGLGPGSVANKAALASFGSGPYICVAKNFAIQEMRHVLTRLVLTFDMTLPSSFDTQAWLRGFRNMRTTMFDEPLLVKPVVRRPRKGSGARGSA